LNRQTSGPSPNASQSPSEARIKVAPALKSKINIYKTLNP
jgi:hypothetical protein